MCAGSGHSYVRNCSLTSSDVTIIDPFCMEDLLPASEQGLSPDAGHGCSAFPKGSGLCCLSRDQDQGDLSQVCCSLLPVLLVQALQVIASVGSTLANVRFGSLCLLERCSTLLLGLPSSTQVCCWPSHCPSASPGAVL